MRILIVIAVATLAYIAAMVWQRKRDRVTDAERHLAWGAFDLAVHGALLDRAVATLVDKFDSDTFAGPPLEQGLPATTDRAVYLRQAVESAAERFQVTLPVVDLRYAPTLGEDASALADWDGAHRSIAVAGSQLTLRYASDDLGTWRIRIDPAFRDNDSAVTILAAHELTHFILHREGLDYTDELLVDTALVLLGYGPLMARFRSTPQPIRGTNGKRQWLLVGPGYLHPQAIDYLMAKRAMLRAS